MRANKRTHHDTHNQQDNTSSQSGLEHDDWVLLEHSRVPPGLEEAIASAQEQKLEDGVEAKVWEVTHMFPVHKCSFVAISTCVRQHSLLPAYFSIGVNRDTKTNTFTSA